MIQRLQHINLLVCNLHLHVLTQKDLNSSCLSTFFVHAKTYFAVVTAANQIFDLVLTRYARHFVRFLSGVVIYHVLFFEGGNLDIIIIAAIFYVWSQFIPIGIFFVIHLKVAPNVECLH